MVMSLTFNVSYPSAIISINLTLMVSTNLGTWSPIVTSYSTTGFNMGWMGTGTSNTPTTISWMSIGYLVVHKSLSYDKEMDVDRDIKFLHPIIRTILGEKSNHFDELTKKLVEKFNAKPHINFMNPSSDNLDKVRLEYYSIAMMFLSSFDCSIKTEIQKEISKIRSSN